MWILEGEYLPDTQPHPVVVSVVCLRNRRASRGFFNALTLIVSRIIVGDF